MVIGKDTGNALAFHGYKKSPKRSKSGLEVHTHPSGHEIHIGGGKWSHTHNGNWVAGGSDESQIDTHLLHHHGPRGPLARAASQHSEEAADEGTEQFAENDHTAALKKHDYRLTGNRDRYSTYHRRDGHSVTLYHDGRFRHINGPNNHTDGYHKELSGHLDRIHKTSQHDEESAPSPKEQFNVRGTSFISSPVKVLEETTQFSEMVEGVYGDALHSKSLGIHNLIRQHGGYSHNFASKNKRKFKVPASKLADFHKAAEASGYKHGEHYKVQS